jgi:hypothetical protein
MKIPIIAIFATLLYVNSIAAQDIKIKSIKTLKGIPFATVSYKKNDSIIGGTYTNENGYTKIENGGFDKILISHIGFEKKEIAIKDIDSIILLEENIIELQEVVISNKKQQPEWIGNQFKGNKVPVSATRGFEFATLIPINDTTKTHHLKALKFFIKRRKETKPAAIKLTFYANKNNLPDETLNSVDITKIFNAKQKGEITVPLEDYNIAVKQDFFIGIEWLGLIDETGNLMLNNTYNDCSLGFDDTKNQTLTYIRNKLTNSPWDNFTLNKNEIIAPVINVEIY